MNRFVFILSMVFVSCNHTLVSSVSTVFDSSDSPISRNEVQYDDNGNVASILYYDFVDGAFVEDSKVVYSCTCSGEITDTVITHYEMTDGEWKPVSRAIDSYNDRFLKFRSIGLNYDNECWDTTFVVSWDFDSLSRISAQISNSWRLLYEYGDGFVRRTELNLEDGKYNVRSIYVDSLDDNGNVIRYEVWTNEVESGFQNKRVSYKTYDENNRVESEMIIGCDKQDPDSNKVEYVYNGLGQIESETQSYCQSGKWNVTNKTDWTYNNNGRLEKKVLTRFDDGVLRNKVITEYEYDRKGNKIREVTSRIRGNDGPATIVNSLVIDNIYN